LCFFLCFVFFCWGSRMGIRMHRVTTTRKKRCVYMCVYVCARPCVCERESTIYLQEIISIIFLIRMYLCTSCYHSRILVTVIIRIRYFISYFQYIRYSHILLTYFHYIRYFEC
jgi:hypothetical protein